MKGTIKNVMALKNFGFILSDGQEFFFHKSDFQGFWDDLVEDFEMDKKIPVEFETVPSVKGPRASRIRRLDHPNTTEVELRNE